MTQNPQKMWCYPIPSCKILQVWESKVQHIALGVSSDELSLFAFNPGFIPGGMFPHFPVFSNLLIILCSSWMSLRSPGSCRVSPCPQVLLYPSPSPCSEPFSLHSCLQPSGSLNPGGFSLSKTFPVVTPKAAAQELRLGAVP